MSERSVVVLSAIAGAALGGVAGFLFLTERGRELRLELEPRLDEFAREFANLQSTVSRATSVATEGWRLVTDAAASRPGTSDWPREQGAAY